MLRFPAMGLAAYLNRLRYWVLALALALLLPGGFMTTIDTLHLVSRWLIAGGCALFALAVFAVASAEVRLTAGQRLSVRALGALALIGAALELLPEQFRSSTGLVIVAAALAIVAALAVWISRNTRSDN